VKRKREREREREREGERSLPKRSPGREEIEEKERVVSANIPSGIFERFQVDRYFSFSRTFFFS
jgi:hypothetical protein